MTGRLFVLVAVIAAGALALAGLGLASSKAPKLTGETGPGFKIEVEMGGKDVKTLKAGTYSLTVEDKAAIHNFRLKGPGLNKQVTTVPFVGKKTVTVTLKKGTYTYQCDPHAASGMKGTFKVT
jgi:hypothetical protein